MLWGSTESQSVYGIIEQLTALCRQVPCGLVGNQGVVGLRKEVSLWTARVKGARGVVELKLSLTGWVESGWVERKRVFSPGNGHPGSMSSTNSLDSTLDTVIGLGNPWITHSVWGPCADDWSHPDYVTLTGITLRVCLVNTLLGTPLCRLWYTEGSQDSLFWWHQWCSPGCLYVPQKLSSKDSLIKVLSSLASVWRPVVSQGRV